MRKRDKQAKHAQAIFSLEDRGDVALLRVQSHEGLVGGDLGQTEHLWNLLQATDATKKKVVVVIIPAGVLSPANVDSFWTHILGVSPTVEGQRRLPPSSHEIELVREENSLSRFVTLVRGINTLVICVLQGEIILPFLGPALACDYRIVAEDTIFVNRCLESRMPPSGALPWFLSRFVGHGKAFEIIFEKESLSAHEARELGLVNHVVSPDSLEQEAIAKAEWFASKPREGLAAAKRMMCAAHWCLGSCLKREEEVFAKCLSATHQPSGEGKGT